MLFFVMLAAGAIWRWYEEPRAGRLFTACGALAAAILEKEPAAALGLLFAWLVFRRLGGAAWRDWRVWLGAAIASIPPLAWYGWAYHFWAVDGNSLGLSDEAHMIGPDILFSRGILGNARFEVRDVFTPIGVVLAAAALRYAWRRIEPAAAWYLSTLAFYFLAARTAGAQWAFYYHCLSAAPACLLMGAGAGALAEIAAGIGAGAARPARRRWAPRLGVLLAVLALASLAGVTVYRLAERDGVIHAGRTEVALTRDRAACAAQFRAAIPPAGRIAVRGLQSQDGAGHLIAYNDPTFFAFADRKGFVYPSAPPPAADTAALPTARRTVGGPRAGKVPAAALRGVADLQALARRGARYWIVAESDLAGPLLPRAEVDRTFSRLATCAGGYALYDLAGGKLGKGLAGEGGLPATSGSPPREGGGGPSLSR